MQNILMMLPNIEGEELVVVQGLAKEMTESQLQQFVVLYGSRRKDPQTILLTTLIAFVGIAGVQRFLLGQIGMGLLYLFTWGLCVIGTIVDIVNYKKLTFEYNWKIAHQVAGMVKSSA
jgi:TM2 domain-containing membrane protein YozV